MFVLTVLRESPTEKHHRPGKVPANNLCHTCIRYGCHPKSSLVILLRPADKIRRGLRRAITSGFSWRRSLTASIFSTGLVALRLPHVVQECAFHRRIAIKKPFSKSVLHDSCTLVVDMSLEDKNLLLYGQLSHFCPIRVANL